MDILDIFRQAIKGGAERLGNEFAPPSEEERMANMNRRPNMPQLQTPAGDIIGNQIADRFNPMRSQDMPGKYRQEILDQYNSGADFGYEGYGPYGQRNVDEAMRNQMAREEERRRRGAFPGSPVNY
tara:strand:- start:18 stop:395 length:378 start_codon:yes stop_codon:yes gene_type:complete